MQNKMHPAAAVTELNFFVAMFSIAKYWSKNIRNNSSILHSYTHINKVIFSYLHISIWWSTTAKLFSFKNSLNKNDLFFNSNMSILRQFSSKFIKDISLIIKKNCLFHSRAIAIKHHKLVINTHLLLKIIPLSSWAQKKACVQTAQSRRISSS